MLCWACNSLLQDFAAFTAVALVLQVTGTRQVLHAAETRAFGTYVPHLLHQVRLVRIRGSN